MNEVWQVVRCFLDSLPSHQMQPLLSVSSLAAIIDTTEYRSKPFPVQLSLMHPNEKSASKSGFYSAIPLFAIFPNALMYVI